MRARTPGVVTPSHPPMWARVGPTPLLGPAGRVCCCCSCCCRAAGAAAGLLLLGVRRVLQLLLPGHSRHLLHGHGCVRTRGHKAGWVGHLARPKAPWHYIPWCHSWRRPKTLREEPRVAHPHARHLHWLHLVCRIVGCCCWEVAWDAGLACCW
jgi:hypothetical protein